MNVDFDSLRKKACFTYDRLAKKLNNSIDEFDNLTIDCEVIKKDMDNLKQLIGTIAMCKSKEAGFKDVFEEIYPGDKAMIDFSPDTVY